MPVWAIVNKAVPETKTPRKRKAGTFILKKPKKQ
jgi:hypothetical protein